MSQTNSSLVTDWPLNETDYELTDTIGRGASAIVIKGRVKKNNKECAIKQINLEILPDNNQVVREIRLMQRCRHENITSYYCCFVVKRKLWIAMELLDGGSVYDIISAQLKVNPDLNNKLLSEQYISVILKGILTGLQYLHKEGYIHRDVKAANILLSKEGDVKLADFGVSSLSASGQFASSDRRQRPRTFVGTPCWMAPEVGDIDNHKSGYDMKADIWSVGITCIEMIFGKPPLYDMVPIKVILTTIRSPPPSISSMMENHPNLKINSQLKRFVEFCLKKSPKERPTATQLLKDKFLNKAGKPHEARKLIKEMVEMNGAAPKNSKKFVKSRATEDDQSCKFVFPECESLRETDSINNSTMTLTSCGVQVEPENENEPEDTPVLCNSTSTLSENCSKTTIQPVNGKFEVILRIRDDESTQLNDIKFPYDLEKDTCDSLSSELAEAGLIKINNRILVSGAMAMSIKTGQDCIFKTHLLKDQTEYNKENLIGYARISVNRLDDD